VELLTTFCNSTAYGMLAAKLNRFTRVMLTIFTSLWIEEKERNDGDDFN
jgi:hypothetical protein